MPANKASKQSGSKALTIILALLFLCQFVFPMMGSFEVSAVRLPITGEVIAVSIEAEWVDVPEEKIPESIAMTITPDGIPFMASDLILEAAKEWKSILAVHNGTKRVEFKNLEIEGLEYQLDGSLDEGYVISYYLQGEAPEIEETEPVETEEVEAGAIDLDAVPTQEVRLKDTPNIAIETKEGESLSDEEYKERLVDAYMREQGYVVDKTPYYIGIGVCVALIIVVIVIRVVIGRKQ